ncbi:MAG: dUTP diphosphatase [Hyphomicrobiaceae bacterium]
MTSNDQAAAVILCRRLAHAADLPLPAYETAGAAGADLRAALGQGQTVTIAAGATAMVPTGLVLALPDGFEGQVRPRSGLAARHGVTVLNAPGTIDSDYRGEVQVLLVNLGSAPFEITHGMRIAQLVVAPVVRAHFGVADALGATERGDGGFGSTGL